MKTVQKINKDHLVIKFAGDSGDGMQLTGNQFTNNTAQGGYDLATFPDFPAEIRAPLGTVAGVSGFQLHFGSIEIDTPGDTYDVLIAMNAAAFKANFKNVKPGGTIIADISGFDKKNLKLAGYAEDVTLLENTSTSTFTFFEVDITKLTIASLQGLDMDSKDKDRSKNMFVLGLVFWLYDREFQSTLTFLDEKFAKNDTLRMANVLALKAGYHYGETAELFTNKFELQKAIQPAGDYRGISGNEALSIGLIMAGAKAKLPLFFATYPITPASDILHFLAKQTKDFNVQTFQAEDEIAAICAAIGASFGGQLAISSTSGPGMALKTEALGLAISLELPLVICNIQRAGPSTGMPTKTEQADLFQALYGRNGEAPLPVIAAFSPCDCFVTAFEAARIALEYMTPVVLLSDLYLANGSEPWKYPTFDELPDIQTKLVQSSTEKFEPYARDKNLVRNWAVPGVKSLEHRIGGLEKQDGSGNVSYDGDNHHAMVKLRAERVEKIADSIPLQTIALGADDASIAIVGWGSTNGSIRTVVKELISENKSVAHIQIKYLNPFPVNLGSLLKRFTKVIVPEINNGQLVKILREKYLIDAIPYNKIKGQPLNIQELKDEILKHC
jgi:2-oxoglutarate ferredoxin oxidoreductase subunit alpha